MSDKGKDFPEVSEVFPELPGLGLTDRAAAVCPVGADEQSEEEGE